MYHKKTIAKKWVKALRSGKYEQTQAVLHDGKGYCCLGVLCKIMGKRFVQRRKNEWNVVYAIDIAPNEYEAYELPEDVMKKTGIKTPVAKLLETARRLSGWESLAGYNDHGADFNTIADIIEKHWEEL